MEFPPAVVDQRKLFELLEKTLRLGRLLEKLHVRAFEDAVRESNSRKPGQRRAAAITNSAHVEQHDKYQPLVNEAMRANGIKYTPAAEQVARQLGVSAKTVLRHTTNPNTQSAPRPE
ncbi:hypothetical protein [Lacipirellula parvula]|uniref:hypothetical protein n=1 Tax=Lacipirellula parvula TaxID=2650471 RepID=UPI0012604AC3|nr:hypothetical protein [Lacipirellula parvula]